MIKFEKELLEKIKNKVSVSEYSRDELFLMTCDSCIKERNIHEGRWSVYTQAVFELGNETFAIDYEKGKTECQEDEFMEKPYKVKKETELIIVEKYVRAEECKND